MGLLVFVLVLALVCWAISLIPFPPNSGPLRNIAMILVILIALLWLLGGSGFVGGPSLRWR